MNVYVKNIRDTAGYFVCDLQTGQVFDPAHADFNGLDTYLSVSEQVADMIGTQSGLPSKKPWWKFW